MKPYAGIAIASALVSAFAFSRTSFGQSTETAPVIISSAGAPDTDLPVNEYRAFDQFSEEHPEVVHQLGRNPRLMQNSTFLSRHAELRDLFNNNPGLSDALENNPGDFLSLTPVAEAEVKHRWSRGQGGEDTGSN
jgi:hypothetical protein